MNTPPRLNTAPATALSAIVDRALSPEQLAAAVHAEDWPGCGLSSTSYLGWTTSAITLPPRAIPCWQGFRDLSGAGAFRGCGPKSSWRAWRWTSGRCGTTATPTCSSTATGCFSPSSACASRRRRGRGARRRPRRGNDRGLAGRARLPSRRAPRARLSPWCLGDPCARLRGALPDAAPAHLRALTFAAGCGTPRRRDVPPIAPSPLPLRERIVVAGGWPRSKRYRTVAANSVLPAGRVPQVNEGMRICEQQRPQPDRGTVSALKPRPWRSHRRGPGVRGGIHHCCSS